MRRFVLSGFVPALLLLGWWLGTRHQTYSLIPPPWDVADEMVDLAVGGINDDAFSAMLLTHLLASAGRVYGAFLLAAALALPLGMLIGRLKIARDLLDPMFQMLRPVPVTAWLPLSMIVFGLGPKSAFFLVALGAFYPILVNTIFGVRSVEPRLSRPPPCLAPNRRRCSPAWCCRPRCRASSPGCAWAWAFPGW